MARKSRTVEEVRKLVKDIEVPSILASKSPFTDAFVDRKKLEKENPKAFAEWRAEWQIKTAQRMKERREKEHEEERNRYKPSTDPRVGECVFCKGGVEAKITWRNTSHLIGGPRRMTRFHSGWSCQKCGLMYKFPPNEKHE